MKRYLSLLFIAFSCISSPKAQINVNASLGEVFRDFMVKTSGRKVEVLQDFSGQGGNKRFFSAYWLIGGATNNYDVEVSKDFYFNFDFLEHELYVKRKDTNIIVNTNYVKRFFILDQNLHYYFVKNLQIDPRGQLFFQSIGYSPDLPDSMQIHLLKLRKVKKQKVNKEDYLNNFNGDFSDVYITSTEYYFVFPDKTYKKVKLNQKDFKKSLPAYHNLLHDFLINHPEITETNIAEFISAINKK